MIGEFSIEGVFMPSLLAIFVIALAMNLALIQFLKRAGLYRTVAAPALVDLALVILIMGGLAALFPGPGWP